MVGLVGGLGPLLSSLGLIRYTGVHGILIQDLGWLLACGGTDDKRQGRDRSY